MCLRVAIFKNLIISMVVRNVETIQLNFYIRVLQHLTLGFGPNKYMWWFLRMMIILRQIMNCAIFIFLLWPFYAGSTEKNAPTFMLKYLFSSSSGLIGFYSDGTARTCPGCNQAASGIDTMAALEPFGTYNDSESSVTLSDDTVMPLYNDGRIAAGWLIVNYQKVMSPRMVTRYQHCSGHTMREQSIDLKETALVVIYPEQKKFANENSQEAQDYYTAMDDWSYYASEITRHYEALGVQVSYSDKKALSFLLGKNECMNFDVKKWQSKTSPEDSWDVFLYRKGQLPIAVDITDYDTSETKNYLR